MQLKNFHVGNTSFKVILLSVKQLNMITTNLLMTLRLICIKFTVYVQRKSFIYDKVKITLLFIFNCKSH